MAMHDSLELAQQIIKFGIEHLSEAVAEYEKLMFPRAKSMIEDSAATNAGMFSEDAPAPLLQMFNAMLQNEKGESVTA